MFLCDERDGMPQTVLNAAIKQRERYEMVRHARNSVAFNTGFAIFGISVSRECFHESKYFYLSWMHALQISIQSCKIAVKPR